MAGSEDAFGMDMVPAVGMQWGEDPDIGGHDDGFIREVPVADGTPATEAERDEVSARDRVRRIILAQAQRLVDTALDVPADGNAPSAYTIVRAFVDAVEPAIREFRISAHQRAIAAIIARRGETL